MIARTLSLAAALLTCSHQQPSPTLHPAVPPPVHPASPPITNHQSPITSTSTSTATATPTSTSTSTPPPATPLWLKGNTHTHAAPSGDSTTPVPAVLAWYANHGYDFIVLTDHNRVTRVDPATIAAAAPGLIVLPGTELTYNPPVCIPPPPAADGKCRIHLNALGVSAFPDGKLDWTTPLKSHLRVDMYQRALDQSRALGGLAQLNHPTWHWGMTAPLLVELAHRGVTLVEIANQQFRPWNEGDADHPSIEALWDQALAVGVTLYGVASDDAHDYDGGGRYPAGGGWVMVHAPRDPAAIRDALARGDFYATTGVLLERAGVESGELVVELAAASPGEHLIRFIGASGTLAEVSGRSARYRVADAPGYVRAVVLAADGSRAWIQPARAP
jgi:hypothetical protein